MARKTRRKYSEPSPSIAQGPARRRRWIGLVAGLAVLLAGAAYIRYRFERAPAAPPTGNLNTQPAAPAPGSVLAAEAELAARPEDLQARLRLAAVCEQAQDPLGAALALYPLVRRGGDGALIARYGINCTRVGWLDEAAACVRRDVPLRLELAAAYVSRGQAPRAAALLAALERETRSSDEWLDGATTWYQCRRRPEAIRWARRGIEAQPDDPSRRALLGRLLVVDGKPEAALKALAGASGPAAEYWQARAGLLGSDPRLRSRSIQQIVQVASGGGSPGAAFEAGRALIRAGRAREAIPLLAQAGDSGYQTVFCYEWLARAYAALGDPANAAWAESRALAQRDRLPEAAAALRRSLKADSRKQIAREDLANLLKQQEKWAEALAEVDRALACGPDATLSFLRADVLGRLERIPEQIRTLEAIPAAHPGAAGLAFRALGDLHFRVSRYEDAKRDYQRALEASEADNIAHRQLGECYARTVEAPGAAEQAIHHLLRAAALDPSDEYAWALAAPVFQRMGRLPEAAACCRRAIAAGGRRELTYLYLAQALQRQNRRPEAELVLRRYQAVRARSVTEMKLDREAEFRAEDPSRRFRWGDFLLRQGRAREALDELLAATALRPGWKEAQSRLADACALLDFEDMMREAESAAR